MPSNPVPLGKDFLLVVHINAEHQPDGHVEHDDRGAAGREKRQGEADDRHDPQAHADVGEDLKEEDGEDPHAEEVAQPVGAAAINSVPRRMIRENVEEVMRLCDYRGGLAVMISVPEGEALAKKTFNPRLGIVGGISILGTTGIVEPMSEQALVDTIHVELRQRRANGADYVLLTPGYYGADFIRASIGLDPRTAVLTSNFIGDALEHCRALGFRGALLVGHIGKLVKLAGGMWNTHSKCGDCRMELIAAHAAALGLPPARVEEVLDCATCDDALRILKEEQLYDAVLARLAERIEFHLAHKCGEMAAGAIVFSKEYGLLCRTSRAQELLGTIMEG